MQKRLYLKDPSKIFNKLLDINIKWEYSEEMIKIEACGNIALSENDKEEKTINAQIHLFGKDEDRFVEKSFCKLSEKKEIDSYDELKKCFNLIVKHFISLPREKGMYPYHSWVDIGNSKGINPFSLKHGIE